MWQKLCNRWEALRNRFLWFLVGLLVVSGLISSWLAQQLARPILVLQQHIIPWRREQLPRRSPKPSRIKEINAISASLNELIQALRQTVDFARYVGQGNFTATYQLLSEQDQLGQALLNMRDQLVQLNVQQERLGRETKEGWWIPRKPNANALLVIFTTVLVRC